MTQIRDRHVLVTGGAQGLGALLAEGCLARGAARVTLWDIDQEKLDALSTRLRDGGHAVDIRRVDLGRLEDILEAAAALPADGPVDILINNAGIVCGRPLAEQSHDEIERTIRINSLGVIHTTRALLPGMLERGRGHVVNLASASGFVPVPRLTTYAASKWACLGFSESLRVELRSSPGLHITTVCPSYIKTGMFDGVSAPFGAPMLEPNYAAERILRAIKRNTVMLRMPRIVHLVPMLYHLLPAPLFDRVCGDWLGIYRSMDHFTGHGARQAK